MVVMLMRPATSCHFTAPEPASVFPGLTWPSCVDPDPASTLAVTLSSGCSWEGSVHGSVHHLLALRPSGNHPLNGTVNERAHTSNCCGWPCQGKEAGLLARGIGGEPLTYFRRIVSNHYLEEKDMK